MPPAPDTQVPLAKLQEAADLLPALIEQLRKAQEEVQLHAQALGEAQAKEGECRRRIRSLMSSTADGLGPTPDQEEAWGRLISLTSRSQRKLLTVIQASGVAGIELDDLCQALGLPNRRSVTGIIGGGLSKNIRKAGLEIKMVLKHNVEGSGNSRVSTYVPGPLLLMSPIPATE